MNAPRSAWRHVPNAITVLRMFAAIPLAGAIRAGHHDLALAWAFAAGASDALDGILAKRFNWSSELGGRLDPIADKLLLFSATLALVIAGELPLWWFALATTRDLVIVAGALAYHHLIGPLQGRPTLLSKATTALQILLVLAVLAQGIASVVIPDSAMTALLSATAMTTAASGVHYVISWSLKAAREWPNRMRR